MSVKKALDFIGAESEITADKDKIKNASHVILPGSSFPEQAVSRHLSRSATPFCRK